MPLELKDVTHTYPGRRAPVLSAASVTIQDGTTVAVLGPSGSGKTTLLMILGMLLHPSEGKVILDGQPAERISAARTKLFGWVFQTANVVGKRTALDNAALGLLSQGLTHRCARLGAFPTLEALGIGHLAHERVETLSGGELQRVCIARALATQPRFVLADEPTGQLDSATTVEVVNSLLEARPPDSSVVIATHDLRVAGMCDFQLTVKDGALILK